MNNPLQLAELQYIMFPAENPQPDYLDIYNETFRCWKEVWSRTFQELDGNGKIFSDDFCRQNFVGGVFWKSRCVSLGLFHSLNMEIPAARWDSYFKVWPDEALARLTADGTRVMVGSNITIDPEFRSKLTGGYRLRDLLGGLMIKTFLSSGEDAMTGTMRCDRGMDRAAIHLGAKSICSGVTHHGVEVNLVAFYRSQLLKQEHLSKNLAIESLWGRRIDYRNTSTQQAKKAVS